MNEQHEKDFEIICKQAYLLNNKHIDRPFIEKYQKAIDILKNKLKLSLNDNKSHKTINAILPIGNNDMNRLTQEEYEILEEVFGE